MNASSGVQLISPGTSATPADERTQWLERLRRSGLSQAAFARTHGVKLSRLRYWLYHPRGLRASAAAAPRWQEIQLPSRPAPPIWGAEISLPGGCTVRLKTELAREFVAPLLARER